MKKKILKLFRSFSKIILPILFKILINLKLNRRVVNFLSERGYKSNDKYSFNIQIENLLKNEKIIALDVGAQGGFNSDNFFPSITQEEQCSLVLSKTNIEPISHS